MKSQNHKNFVRLAERTFELFIFVLTMTLLGAWGYMKIENVTFLDGLYMTVITMSSVGFHEVFPLSTLGRLWTSGLIFIGITSVAIWVAIVAAYLFESDISITRLVINRRLSKKKLSRSKTRN